MKRALYLFILSLATVLLSCSNSDDNTTNVRDSNLSLTIMTSLSGAGDNGYNDKITAGVMRFYESHDVPMSFVSPATKDEARQAFRSWLAANKEKHSLLVLAGSDYKELLKSENITLGKRQKILMFESDAIPNISTFRIQRYGASYLAGCMASPHQSATVVAAMPYDPIVNEAIEGFTNGYRFHCNKGGKAEVAYLADDYSGFALPDSAYRLAKTIEQDFIFPLAGGSNNGLYKYSREHSFVTMLVAGMDTDCSPYSKRVPFSVVVHIDKVVEQYLNNWYQGENLPNYQTFGLESGFVDILISPLFYDFTDIWEDYYLDEEYWQNAYNQYKAEAIKKESEYEAK